MKLPQSVQFLRLAAAVAALSATLGCAALAADLKVLSVGTVGSVLHELIPAYERQTGNKVQINFGNPAITLERLVQGEPADVVMVAGATWDQAERLGKLRPETKTIIPPTPFYVGMKASTKSLEPLTADNLARIVKEAKSIALVDRSGATPLLTRGLEKLGVSAQLQAKSRTYPTGSAIAEALARGEVDVGITTLSELVSVNNVRLLGPVPSDILAVKATTTAGITKETLVPQEAAALIQFLTSPAAMAVFKAKGFEAN